VSYIVNSKSIYIYKQIIYLVDQGYRPQQIILSFIYVVDQGPTANYIKEHERLTVM